MSRDEWFILYVQSHRNPINVAIHKAAVPVLFASILGERYLLEISLWSCWKNKSCGLGLAFLLFYAAESVFNKSFK